MPHIDVPLSRRCNPFPYGQDTDATQLQGVHDDDKTFHQRFVNETVDDVQRRLRFRARSPAIPDISSKYSPSSSYEYFS